MNRDLYYCEFWQHKTVLVGKQAFDICVSPMVTGNDSRSMVQFHAGIFLNGGVAKACMLNELLDGTPQEVVTRLEERLRAVLRDSIRWGNQASESGTVKIWYLEETDKEPSGWPESLPLRFAITVINVEPIDDEQGDRIRSGLEDVITNWLLDG